MKWSSRFIRKKKLPKTSIIQLSQMNRNIEQPERINNPAMHYPLRSDLAASDALFHASDYVIVINRPELQNLSSYGVRRLPVKNKVYMHFLISAGNSNSGSRYCIKSSAFLTNLFCSLYLSLKISSIR